MRRGMLIGLVAFLVLVLLTLMALPVFAQAVPGETPTPGEVGSGFLAWLEDVFLRGVGGGALVYTITQIVKLFVAPEQFPARYIQLVAAIVVWVLLVLGRNLGFDQVDTVYKFLEAVSPHILALLTSILTSGGAYLALRNQGVPLLGTART